MYFLLVDQFFNILFLIKKKSTAPIFTPSLRHCQKVYSKFADKETEYDVTVLEQKGNKSKVEWLGYHDHKPSWIPTSQLVSKVSYT